MLGIFQMKTPAIQNDFSYYRRTLTGRRITQDVDPDVPNPVKDLNNDTANRMSLFYANATPMLRVLSDATTKFVNDVSRLRIFSLQICIIRERI